MNTAQPPRVPISHCTGARVPCVASRYSPGLAPRALTVPHAVHRAPPVVLRAALAEAQQRTIAQQERHARLRGTEREALQGHAIAALHVQHGRRVGHAYDDVA
jgi:hypothetical protein